MLVIEVEHDGTLTAEDRAFIDALLSESPSESETAGQVGLRNVRKRLSLLYGEKGELSLTQSAPDKILARVCFPSGEEPQKEARNGKRESSSFG